MSMDDPGLKACVPFRFACTRCGHCCSGGSGHVWLEPGESEAMAAHLGMSAERFEARYVRVVLDPKEGVQRRSLVETQAEGGPCALLEGRNTCRVYPVRPAHCRRFPYWDSVLNDAHSFEAARATCPGIAVQVSDELRERARLALQALYAELDSMPVAQRSQCCWENSPEELWASGMEADQAALAQPEGACALGSARPLACRLRHAGLSYEVAEVWQARLRALERELGYPASYARWMDLVRARG